MCKLCCSHTQLELQQQPPCNREQLYHVAHFTVPRPIFFPGERYGTDVYTANSLRLMADIRTTGLRPALHIEPHWPRTATLLPRLIAVSPSPDAPYGALVAFDKRRPSMTEFANFFRFHLVVVGRYKLARPPASHSSYPCVLVTLICEDPSIPQPSPDRLFPFLTPSPLRRSARTRILTRSAVSALRAAPRLRSSVETGGLSYSQWRSVQPEVLVSRACAAAAENVHKFRPLVADDVPQEPCPSWWSFWLCQCLSLATPNSLLYQLNSETSVVRRLRTFIDFVRDEKPVTPPVEERLRLVRSKRPAPLRKSPSKKRRTSAKAPTPHLEQPPSPTIASSLLHILGPDPWPCSPAKGFDNVNLAIPCRGRFRPIRPHACEVDTQASVQQTPTLSLHQTNPKTTQSSNETPPPTDTTTSPRLSKS